VVLGLFVVAGGLLVFSGVGLWQKYRATHNPRPLPPPTKTVSASVTMPDETPIAAASHYQVPAGQPRQITLPTIGAEGFIQKVSIDQHGAIAVPSNVHMAGWYTGEAVPGEPGLSIMDGHVQGKYQPGIFQNLRRLKPKDTFSVAFGNGSSRQFEVVSVTLYATQEVTSHLFKKHGGIPAQLNLITCGGTYNTKSQQYDKRVLVISKLLVAPAPNPLL
jgi:hypothetical protein